MSEKGHTGETPMEDDDIASETELTTTPPMSCDDSGLKVTKKRERELSLEPSTSKELAPSVVTEQKEPRAPAKKNRLEPITTADDEEPIPSTPPPSQHELSTPPPVLQSPQHETKVTQIRKRVEDMTWQDQVESGRANIGLATDNDRQTTTTTNPLQDDHEADSVMNASQETPSMLTHGPDESLTGGDNDQDGDAIDNDNEAKASLDTACEDEADRSLKRKLQDRTSSYNATSEQQTRQDSSKRPRDDAHSDPNPRGVKRASPPPTSTVSEQLQSDPAPALTVSSGFLAFAAASSPFAKAKPSPTSWSTPSTSLLAQSAPTATESADLSINTGSKDREQEEMSSVDAADGSAAAPLSDSKPKPIFGVTSAPGQGFTGFANLSSPFSSVFVAQTTTPSTSSSHAGPSRSKSPTRHGSAFTPYNSAVRGFATPKSPRRKRSYSPTGSSGSAERTGPDEGSASLPESENDERSASFSDRLQKDHGATQEDHEASKVDLQEQETITGEEDERTVYSVRAKLYILSDQKQWKEKGIGPLKLNVRKTDGGTPRLIMRKEGVHSLVLNVLLFAGIKFEIAQDPRYVRFGVPNELKKFDHYNLRLSSAKAAEELVEAVSMSVS